MKGLGYHRRIVGPLRRLGTFVWLFGVTAATGACTFPNDWGFASGGAGGSAGATSSSTSATGGGSTTSATTAAGGDGGSAGQGGSGASGGNGGTGGAAGNGGTGGSGGTGGAGGGMCGPNTGDCDMDPTNGCEASLTSTQNCGACGVPCQLPNAVDPCATGQCILGTCISPFENCDGIKVNGCEANLLTDKLNCGVCGTICNGNMPNCNNGVCTAACSADAFEPNDLLQPPAPPPMAANMVVFDAMDNDFKLSANKTASVSPNFTTNGDVDVFYLHVTDDMPLPMGKTIKGSGFDISLSQVPAGATYSITSYFICDDMSPGVSVFNVGAGHCPLPGANTGYSGDWWYCQQYAPSPGKAYTYGHRCTTSGDANGILQIEVKVIGPPAAPTCDPYTITVHAFQIAL